MDIISQLIDFSDDWQTFREKLFNSFYFRENGVTDVSKTTSSIVSFDVLRGILSTAYRTTFTPSEIHALAYELDVVKKLRGDVVVDLNSLLVKLKRLGKYVYLIVIAVHILFIVY